MPRYRFHVRLDGYVVHDEDGLQLADLDAAKLEAIITARELAIQHLKRGWALDLEGEVVIEEEGAEAVAVITLVEALRLTLK